MHYAVLKLLNILLETHCSLKKSLQVHTYKPVTADSWYKTSQVSIALLEPSGFSRREEQMNFEQKMTYAEEKLAIACTYLTEIVYNEFSSMHSDEILMVSFTF